MVIDVVVIVVDGLVLDVEQLGLEEVHGPGLAHALLLLLLLLRSLDLVDLLTSPLFLLFRDDLGGAPLLPPTEEHLVALELGLEESDRRGGEVSHRAGLIEALGAPDTSAAELAVDDAFHDLTEMTEVTNRANRKSQVRQCLCLGSADS